MLSIFDQQKQTLAAANLVADGVLSLLRQWVLRPEFWKEPIAPPAPDSVPGFYMIESFIPRVGSLFDGALMSLVVFASVGMIMDYTWNHPALMPAISVYRSGSPIWWRPPISPSTSSPSNPQAAEQPIYVDGGRVVLMIQPSSPRASKK
jgi:hypothetical protein